MRILAATNADLRKMVEEKKFREDLYYRLNVININLPPLRDRREDIPLLVQHFLDEVQPGKREVSGRERAHACCASIPEAMQLLLDHTGRATCANSRTWWSARSCWLPRR